MDYNVLPVVMGGADYSKIAPPKSYIDQKDFSSPKDLAYYLKYLLKNGTAYQEYFIWKTYFKVYRTSRAMCHLCEKLNSEIPQPKIYENINDWWSTNGTCEVIRLFSLSEYDGIFSLIMGLLFGVICIIFVCYMLFKFSSSENTFC